MLGVVLTSSVMAHAQGIEINTARGQVNMEKAVSNNVAVYDMAAMDTLEALGVVPKGIVSKILVDYLQDAKTDASIEVGTLFEPDMEALNRLKPEAIIIGGRMAPKYDAIAQVGPVVDMTNTGVSVDTAQKLIVELGKLFGKQEQAQAMQKSLSEELTKTKAVLQDQGKALMIMVNGPKIASFGVKSRFGYLFNDYGWQAADTNDSTARHGQPVSFEFIRKLDPDWLIVMDRTSAIQAKGENAQAVLDNALLKDSKAFKNNQVIYLDSSSYLASGGYQQMMRELKLLREAVAQAKGEPKISALDSLNQANRQQQALSRIVTQP